MSSSAIRVRDILLRSLTELLRQRVVATSSREQEHSSRTRLLSETRLSSVATLKRCVKRHEHDATDYDHERVTHVLRTSSTRTEHSEATTRCCHDCCWKREVSETARQPTRTSDATERLPTSSSRRMAAATQLTPTLTVPAPAACTGYTHCANNGTACYNSELYPSGGNGLSRYITRPVPLADGFEARDIQVLFDAYRPLGSHFYVYYKVLPGNADQVRFEDQVWRPMTDGYERYGCVNELQPVQRVQVRDSKRTCVGFNSGHDGQVQSLRNQSRDCRFVNC
jgi:hypothetical protein